jgi:predicted DNA-binding transcriptional regulator AlpA
MPLVRYRYLKEEGIISDRMALARAIDWYGFPRPIALGANTLAWDLDEVKAWITSRPRVAPKTGAKRGPKPLPAIVTEAV